MGIFGLFKKKVSEEQKQEKVELRIENLVDWITKSNAQKINSVLSELNVLWNEISRQISIFQSSVSVLEKAKFEPNDRMYAPINMIKDSFTKKAKTLNKMPKSIGKDFSSIKSAYTDAVKTLSNLKDTDTKQAYVISIYFKKEADDAIKALKNIDNLLSTFDKKLNSEGQVLELVESVTNKTKRFFELEKQLKEAQKTKGEAENETVKKEKDIEKLNQELEKINSDKGWEELNKTNKELNDLKTNSGKIKHSFREELSSINRPLKKVSHASETRFQIDDIDIENTEAVYSTANMIDNILSKNQINLKASELEKINDFKEKVKSGLFEEYKKDYNNLIKKTQDLESKLLIFQDLEKAKLHAEKKLEDNKTVLEKLKEEIKSLNTEEEKTKKDAENIKLEIKDQILQKLGVEIKIN